MKIIIVGAGVVGESLCSELSEEGNDVILIEKREEVLNRIIDTNDITGLVGNGASYENLLEAGADSADVFIAVTEADELNIISCIIAKKIGAKYTIARVRNPEYSTNMRFVREELGISMMINPEAEAAKSIISKLKFPNAISVDSIFSNRANILELEITKESSLNGVMLKNLGNISSDKIIVFVVKRGDDIFIPTGNFILSENDSIYVTGTNGAITKFYNEMGYENKNIDSAMLVGGGTISHYLTERLLNNKKKVKIIESDREKAEKLSRSYPEAVVIYGEETDQEFLVSEGIKNYDAVLALTDKDEENVVISMFAKSINSGKIMIKMSRTLLLPVLDEKGLYSIIVPKKIISDIIIRVVRSKINAKGSKMNTLHRLVENRIEAIVFEVSSQSKVTSIPIKDLKVIPNLLITCILRGEEMIYPGGNDIIQEKDKVMIVTFRKAIEDIDDILM
ncbi:Trk system potassium transporter TrkA [Leptotrichia sp. OH3620_COT-345]|uniref:Trk system potassium transporter TrkA n=1 Tax=Leptotrichia sp. OH3620_COT-345 TaxID=2491048 RepID=UPI000F646F2A|nr:Trk system potassium transporter TrkA [Leptotrichia sp. OH3620_COT-345]RRD40518.1 Trk system potassium transporter TrkA [Leptotrichia sp. OH3620_COT-345]